MSEIVTADRLVVIGNGMAAGRVLEELFKRAPGRHAVTIFGAEPRVNYNRIMLSPLLSGEKTFSDIVIHDEAWYRDHGVALRHGVAVTAIDRAAKTVTASDGSVTPYDRLLIATGSSPIIIPVPGHALPGVIAYRDLDDVDRMLEAAAQGGRAVVIGGGLLGLEAAAGLRERGMEVTVLHLMATLMERQLDQAAGHLLQKAIEARGIAVITRADTAEILGEEAVTGVRLKDGRVIEASLVVMAVGIRPNAALAKAAGVAVHRGVVIDDQMATSDPFIDAVGECVEHRGQCYGLVAPLYEMARHLAARLAGEPTEGYAGSVTSTKLKVTGIDLFSAGDFTEADGREEIVLRDAARGVYKRLVIADNRIVGSVMYGDTGDGAWFFRHLKDGVDISAIRDRLIHGEQVAAAANGNDPLAAVAALPDDAEICGCNGVCKGAIVNAIREKGLSTIEEVRAHTKASASCGSCTPQVERLMQATLGDAYATRKLKPMCGCTDHDHDTVRRAIVELKLKSLPDVLQRLEWKTSCGCAKCRPALNYYLVCAWPGEYEDDHRSRLINERVHANIQKDGTYSVMPRMWGGYTTPDELRALADVADRFAIPSVKVTGGQRIDLLGVRKEDLPAVWADLNAAGMISGAAYSKGLRTVKTCVGSDWCRVGTQDSAGLGIRLEKVLWGAWSPHKLKLGVSGCPRNCAEATVKDIGVICTDAGYDIVFAGAAGMHVRATDLLTKVATEDEVIEHVVALTQYYREDARYLERIYTWAVRVGVDKVRATICDDVARRKAFAERFSYSQRFAQIDPWAERVAGKDAHEFAPIDLNPFLEAAE
jgi:nitrite reductase (NADH) large subunit